jgi:hypothetical protein
MKKLLTIGLLTVAFTVIGQTNEAIIPIPDELLNTPLKNWQLNGVTALIAVQVLGRAFKALKNGGGLRGIFSAIVNGTNTPTQAP